MILLVDDNAADARLIQLALAERCVEAFTENPPVLVCAHGGGEAIARLSGCPQPPPRLILCDLAMPGGLDGFGVLEWVRGQACYDHVPFLMLTGTENPDDIDHCYELGADGYLPKRADWEGHRSQARAILRWYARRRGTPQTAEEIDRCTIETLCRQLGVDFRAVSGASQEQHVVAARNRVVRVLMGNGLPAERIARVLKRSARTFQRAVARARVPAV